jgi:hypothetical protein
MNDGTFRLKRLRIETQRERIIVIHGTAVARGSLGFNPTDRARVIGKDPQTGQVRDVSGVLGFCSDTLIEEDEIGLTEDAFRDLGQRHAGSGAAQRRPGAKQTARGEARSRRLRFDHDRYRASPLFACRAGDVCDGVRDAHARP